MDTIRQYLISVICAAVICSVVTRIAGEKSFHSSAIKLLAGIFMSITVISPLVKLQITDFSQYIQGIESDAQLLVGEGQDSAAKETSLIISGQIEAYILDKAKSLDADITVQVMLTDTNLPCAANLSGAISPYAKQQLQKYIANDLGIPEEKQNWS